MISHSNSDALWAHAQRVLAGGPATLSKLPSRYPSGIAPKFLIEARNEYVFDEDDHEYVDMVAALGPILLGHNHAAVTQAVLGQIMESGITSSTLPTALEVEVAELLTEIIPGAEMVRFATNGADVTNAAVKLARYHTGNQHVIYTGYAGGNDSYLSTTDKRGGILDVVSHYNHQIPWRFISDLHGAIHMFQQQGENLAAIVVEVPPEPFSTHPNETKHILEVYRDTAHANGALFILDEVVTGFRYALGGAQEYYSITADLATFSKGMANGYPCAAITGPRHIMRHFEGGTVFLSTTFGAHAVGLAACKATINVLRNTKAHASLVTHGTALQHRLHELLETMIPTVATLRGNFARMVIDWHDAPGMATKDELRTLWLQETCKHGVLFGVPIFPMACWTEETVNKVMIAASHGVTAVFNVIKGVVPMGKALECPVISDVFQRYEPQEKM